MAPSKQIIVCFSGRKKSGKDTLCKYLTDNSQRLFGVPSSHVGYNPMAKPLKDMCVNILGLKHEQVWGTEEQKNSLTHLYWEDLPHYLTLLSPRPVGLMTGREVLEQVGTNIFRKMYAKVWCEAWARDVKAEGKPVVVCSDVRFEDEVDIIHGVGGLVYRVTRNCHAPTVHVSDWGLDEEFYDWNNFDGIIRNDVLGIDESNRAAVQMLWAHKALVSTTDFLRPVEFYELQSNEIFSGK